MITDEIKALAAAKANFVQLEQSIASSLDRELAALPATYGFSDVGAFIRAVKAAGGRRRGRPAKPPIETKRSKRIRITDAIRARVKKLVMAGKSGSQIAKSVGISPPSVQNVKKALGLVRPRQRPHKKPWRTAPKQVATPKLRKMRKPAKPVDFEATLNVTQSRQLSTDVVTSLNEDNRGDK
jgi:transposase